MAKIRVHEIAKEYDVTAKEVINFSFMDII